MKIRTTEQNRIWLELSVRERLNYLKPRNIFLPLPDFSLKGSLDSPMLPSDDRLRIARSIEERFPVPVPMPTEHPAFNLALMHLAPKFFNELSPIDAAWQREIRHRAIIKDETLRLLKRENIQEFEQYLHELRSDIKAKDSRAFYFARTFEKAVHQTQTIAESNKNAYEQTSDLQSFALAIRDERKVREFMFRFLQEYAPTQQALRARFDEAANQPSMTQRLHQSQQQITPYIIFLKALNEFAPDISREHHAKIFAPYAQFINQSLKHAADLEQMTKAIDLASRRTWIAQSKAAIAQPKTDVLYDRLASTNFDSHEQFLHAQDIVQQARAGKVYAHKKNLLKKLEATPPQNEEMANLTKDSLRLQVQFEIINQFVNTIALSRYQMVDHAGEITNTKERQVHRDKLASEFTLVADAEKSLRLRHAAQSRELFEYPDIRATMAALLNHQALVSQFIGHPYKNNPSRLLDATRPTDVRIDALGNSVSKKVG